MNYDKVSRLSSKLKVFCEIMKRGGEKRDIQGNFSNSGVPTSRRIQETMSERPKRPQQASLADFLEIPEATDEQRPQVSDAQHDAKQDIGSLSSVCRETPSHSLQQEHRTRWSRLGSKITSLADCQDILLTVSMQDRWVMFSFCVFTHVICQNFFFFGCSIRLIFINLIKSGYYMLKVILVYLYY